MPKTQALLESIKVPTSTKEEKPKPQVGTYRVIELFVEDSFD